MLRRLRHSVADWFEHMTVGARLSLLAGLIVLAVVASVAELEVHWYERHIDSDLVSAARLAAQSAADAVSGRETLQRAPEARKQAILADRLVISKVDLAGDTAAAALADALKTLNPRAELEVASHGALAPEKLTEPVLTQRNAFVAEAEHGDGVGSFVFTDERPIPWPVFSRALDTLVALRAPDLLRMKGFLNVDGCTGPVLVQAVQHLTNPPVELEHWPDEARGSRVVFITRGITEKQVRDLIDAVWALSS